MKHKNLFGLALIGAVLMLAMIGFARAESNSTYSTSTTDNETDNENALKAQALDVRYEHLVCKVDLTSKQIDLIASDIPAAPDLGAQKDALASDMNTLESYKDANNKTAFDSFVTDVLRKDLQNATAGINGVKKNFNSYNLSNQTKADFKKELQSYIADYNACVSNKDEAMAKVMEKHYTNEENQWQQFMKRMQAKNISTEEMNQIIEDMQTKLEALQDALSSKNATMIQAAMGDLRGSYLHLWARFETAKLKGYMKKLGPLAEKYNDVDQLTQIQNALNSIAPYTEKGHKYGQGELNKVWNTLSNANKDLRDASKNLLKQQIEYNKEQGKQQQDQLKDQRENGSGNGKGPKNRTGDEQ